VAKFAERLQRGVKDFFLREQEQRGNDFRVFSLFVHAPGRRENFIAPFDGGFSGERAKPFLQFPVMRDGMNQDCQRVKSRAGVCCHDCFCDGVSKVEPKRICCQRLWRKFFRAEFS